MYFFVSDKKCCQICTYPVYLLVLTSAMKLKDANYKSHWTILVLFDQWKKMSDLNMSHEDMSDFVLFPLLGFTLVIKLRNFKYFFGQQKTDGRFEYIISNSGWFGLGFVVWEEFCQ